MSHKSKYVNTEDRKHTHNCPYTFCYAINRQNALIVLTGKVHRNCTASGWTDLLVPHEDACSYTFNESLHFIGEVGGILAFKCEIKRLLSMLNFTDIQH